MPKSRAGSARIFYIRFDIYQWKFLVKFINNFLAQVTPFVFYLIGGYLAITGRSRHRTSSSPSSPPTRSCLRRSRDLIDWDQQRLDVQSEVRQVVESFTIGKVLDPALQQLAVRRRRCRIRARDRVRAEPAIRDRSGRRCWRRSTVKVVRGESVAAVGQVGAGGEYLARGFSHGLSEPAGGRILLDGTPIETLPDAVTGRCIGYAEASTYFPSQACAMRWSTASAHAPLRVAREGHRAREAVAASEALASGNPETDVTDDWIDYDAAGRDRTGRPARPAPRNARHRGPRERRLPARAARPYAAGEAGGAGEARILAARDGFRERLIQTQGERYVEAFRPRPLWSMPR